MAPVTVRDCRVAAPATVKAPDSVTAPATVRVPPMAVLPVKVAAPATAKVEAREAAPETVRGAEIEVVPFREMTSDAPPPTVSSLADKEVKEPKGAFKDEPTIGPVETNDLAEMALAVSDEAYRLGVVIPPEADKRD